MIGPQNRCDTNDFWIASSQAMKLKKPKAHTLMR